MVCTVHGTLQARILEWVAFPFSRESSQPRNWSWVSHITGGLFTVWAPRSQGKPLGSLYPTIYPSLIQRPLISQKLNHTWSSSCKGLFNFPAFAVQEGWHFFFFCHLAYCSIPNSFPNSTQNVEHKHLLKEGNWKLIHGFCHIRSMGIRFPRWLNGKESACKRRTHRFSPWVGKIPWSRKWQPTPVFFPRESRGQRSMVGYSPWGRKESDTTDLKGILSGDICKGGLACTDA